MAFFAVQLGYSQVALSADEEVIGTSELVSVAADIPYFAIKGQETLTLSGGYAGGRYTVWGWSGFDPDSDWGFNQFIDLFSYNYQYEWRVEGMGTRCYVTGIGRFADVSIYSDTHGSIRVICDVSSNTGVFLGTATGYINF